MFPSFHSSSSSNRNSDSIFPPDIFNDELQLGIEYNGRQHYEFTPYFHKNEQAFLDQKYRDELKYKRCKENWKIVGPFNA